MLLNTFEHYKMLKNRNISLIYSGPIWSDSVEEIGETLRKRLAFDSLSFSTSQSVFSVFIEQMNNISMYSAEKEEFVDSDEKLFKIAKGVFILGIADGKYFLQTGNLMENHSVELVRSRIDYLNGLTKQDLRQYYKEQLRSENTNPESKGAGLGLTEIAKRASSKIEYEFTPTEDGYTFFTMLVEMGGGK